MHKLITIVFIILIPRPCKAGSLTWPSKPDKKGLCKTFAYLFGGTTDILAPGICKIFLPCSRLQINYIKIALGNMQHSHLFKQVMDEVNF